VGKMIATLKVFLNEATEKGVNKNLAFQSRKFTVLKEEITNEENAILMYANDFFIGTDRGKLRVR
jgi:hypothetical protein